jgi:hypothetical protein
MVDTFKPGEKVKKSGIYSVTHDGEHAQAHEVTCVAGKTFPPCEECGEDVRFLLVKHAKHVGHHEHFKP